MKKTESISSVKRVLQEHINSIEAGLALLDSVKYHKSQILNSELNTLLERFPLNAILSSIDNHSLNNPHINKFVSNYEANIKKQHSTALQHISIYEKELLSTKKQLSLVSTPIDTTEDNIINIKNKIATTSPGKFSPYEDIFKMEESLKIDWQELVNMKGIKKFYHTNLSSQSSINRKFIENISAIDKEDYLDYKQNRNELFHLSADLEREGAELKNRQNKEEQRVKDFNTLTSHQHNLEQKIHFNEKIIQKNQLGIWNNLTLIDKVKKVITQFEDKTDREFLDMALQVSTNKESINDFVAKYIKLSQIITAKPHEGEEKLLSQVRDFKAGLSRALSKMRQNYGNVKIDLQSISNSAEKVSLATKQLINNYEKNTQCLIGFAGLSLAMYGLFNFDMIEEKIEELSEDIHSSGFIGDTAQFALFNTVFESPVFSTEFDNSLHIEEISTVVSDSISSISDFSSGTDSYSSSTCDSSMSVSSFD